MNLYELERYLEDLLGVSKFKDYCPNGIQVEGKAEINTIVSGVTASQALLDRAVSLKADAVLVHHGYFWRGESPLVRGMKKKRLATLLQHDMSLLAYHLPLDAHPELGNNVQLARCLGIKVEGTMDERELQGVGNVGVLTEPMTLTEFALFIASALQREPTVVSGGSHLIKRIAWCTGGAQSYIDRAVELGVDAYLSGEISEQTTHSAREGGIHYIAAGHHATECYGVQALGEHLAERFGVKHLFLDLDNPA